MLTGLLRRVVPRPIKKLMKRALGRTERRLHSDWRLLERIGPVEGPHLVLDVGAHHGWFFHCWRDWCPEAEVHAFEPTAESFDRCRELYGHESGVHLVRAAVGKEAGEAELRKLSASDVSNSLLDPKPEEWRAIEYETGEVQRETVPVIRLDDYARERGLGRVHLLKIDVQGFELAVLEGATELLERVDHVFVESGIRPLYEGGARFTQVDEAMTAAGFHLIGWRAWHRGNHALVEADLLYRRDELRPPVDREAGRVYEAS